MKILFISNVYPPEVAPLANRLSEHARKWVQSGVSLEVVCPNPNYPEGILYPDYTNHFRRDNIDGVTVTRVKTMISPNKGSLKRTISYISFMVSSILYGRRLAEMPDVVIASSPHIFSAVAGLFVSRRLGKPFVLEIRDLWPESIVAVGASKRNWLIRRFEDLEMYLYRNANLIIAVTDTFKKVIAEKGIDATKIAVVKNGAVIGDTQEPDAPEIELLRKNHDLDNKFVASYIGTIGMAHSVGTIVEAARRCTDPDIVFLVAGSGAERNKIEEMLRGTPLPNFRLLGKVAKPVARQLMALSDASIVHLKDTPVFKTVLPSKLFDAMAARKPVILGVRGESQQLIESAKAGIVVEPENPESMLDAVTTLKNNPLEARAMGNAGYQFLRAKHDREVLAQDYLELLNGLFESDAFPSTAINDLAA